MDRKDLKRTLEVLAGIPAEIVRRAFNIEWRLDKTVVYRHPITGKTITAPAGMRYDRFSWFPDLRKRDGSRSDGSPIHDRGWQTGKWDDGSMLTFDQNNNVLRDILLKEKHPVTVVRMVYWGVSRDFMRRKWRKKFGHE